MKKFFAIMALAMSLPLGLLAQNTLNDKADSIIGEYFIPDKTNNSKVRFTKNADGTYKCQIFWMENCINPDTGKPWPDSKNPDKSLRDLPVNETVLIYDLKYDAEKKVWNGAKIYDPSRGIKANVTCQFMPDGQFQLKGTVLGIGEKVYWKKIK